MELLVTEEDILDIVMKLPNWKYLDNDGIQVYLLKYLEQLHQQIIQQISELINNSKTIPDELLEGNTCLIYENGNLKDSTNYLPITCLNILLKVLTSCYKEMIEKQLKLNQSGK